jgi:medium-chain acyl-[acyl-carrier-protein] hydrolase
MEREGIWTENFRIQAAMVDPHTVATIPALANLFQEVANNHAFSRQLDFFNMRERGLFWVLNRFRMQIIRYPAWRDTITLQTWVSAMMPFSHRHLAVYDAENQPLVHATTIWIPLDFHTHRPRRLDNFEVLLNDRNNPCPLPDKLPAPADPVLSTTYTVAYSDLDMLGHVNNVQYMRWFLDDHFRDAQAPTVTELSMHYLAEAFHGDVVHIFKTTEANKSAAYELRRASDGVALCRGLIYSQIDSIKSN